MERDYYSQSPRLTPDSPCDSSVSRNPPGRPVKFPLSRSAGHKGDFGTNKYIIVNTFYGTDVQNRISGVLHVILRVRFISLELEDEL